MNTMSILAVIYRSVKTQGECAPPEAENALIDNGALDFRSRKRALFYT